MIALRESVGPTDKPARRKGQWLGVLETELRRRMGWVDEAISPFGRTKRKRKARATLRNAA